MLYDEDQVALAIADVKAGISVKSVARKYQIPRTTLLRRLKGTGRKECGPDTILTEEEEDMLVKWLLDYARKGFPRRKMDLLLNAKEVLIQRNRVSYLKNNMPGEGWYRGFLKRHPLISMRTSEPVTQASACVSDKDIQGWFGNIEQVLKEDGVFDVLSDPSRIFNGDESGFLLNPGNSNSVFAQRGSKIVYEIDCGQAKSSLTVMFSFSAVGTIVPPMIIFPYKRIPTEIVNTVPHDWGIGRSESGRMRAEVFYEYICNIFIPFLVSQKIKLPVILFVDGHKSHLTRQLSETCSDSGTILISLYPNATRILQPADVAAFRPLKELWRQNVSQWLSENPGREITRKHFAPILQKTLNQLKPETIINGFKTCGIYPWDPKAIDYKKCLGKGTEEKNSSEIALRNTKTLSQMEFEEFVGDEILEKLEQDVLNSTEKCLKKIWCYFKNETEGEAIIPQEKRFNDDTEYNNNNLTIHQELSKINENNNSQKSFAKRVDRPATSSMVSQTPPSQHLNDNKKLFNEDKKKISPLATLFWPETPKRKGKRNIKRFPYVVSSARWQKFYDNEEERKKEENQKKEQRKIERELKKTMKSES